MADDIQRWSERTRWVIAKVTHDWAQTDEMMRLMVADGVAAMRYGQFGNGNIPDPTSQTAFTTKRIVDEHGYVREVIIWRDHRPEDDLAGQHADRKLIETALERMDERRRRYMSANLDIRNRLDPTDFCVVHFALHLYEGHRRVKGNLCSTCGKFYDEHKREPTGTEADYFHRHGRWPHRPIDPKERRAV